MGPQAGALLRIRRREDFWVWTRTASTQACGRCDSNRGLVHGAAGRRVGALPAAATAHRERCVRADRGTFPVHHGDRPPDAAAAAQHRDARPADRLRLLLHDAQVRLAQALPGGQE
eukprot:7383131-Prymnesium_polylepis.1